MKIEQIRFKNLNSLYGEWSIDLTLPEYQSNGIFAITGATGAGKSTILDAICLALYGSTPRLQNISKSSNEIMSRQTWECFAEIIFQVNNERFCCNWSQRRAYKKSDGKLSESKHEISNAETGEVLETKKRDVATFIIEKTGMDLDRFTRSILLAQGGFSAFLKATPDERGPILEQITGTGIYSDISKKIHEKQREENEKYQILIAESKGITFLTEAEEISLQEEIESKSLLESSLIKRSNDLRDQIVWKNKVDDLKREIENINNEITKNRLEEEAFKNERLELNLGRKTQLLLSDYNALQNIVYKQNSEEKTLIEIKKDIIKQQQTDLEHRTRFNEGELQLLNAKKLFQEESEIIVKVRKIDYEIYNQKDDIKKEKIININLEKDLTDLTNEKIKIQDKLLKLESENVKVDNYILHNSCDSSLSQNINSIKKDFEILQNKDDEIYFNQIKLEKQKDKYSKSLQTNILLKDEINKVSNKIDLSIVETNKIKKDLDILLNGKLHREYTNELNSLIKERALHVKIASLEDERTKLLDGKPCPLCGSEHHPFALGNIPNIEEIDESINKLEILLDNIETQENILGDLIKRQTLQKEQLTVLEKDIIKSDTELNAEKLEQNRLEDEIIKQSSFSKELGQSVLIKLEEYNIGDFENSNREQILQDLEKRESLWSQNIEKQNSFKHNKLQLENNIESLNSKLEFIIERKNISNENITKLNEVLTLSLKVRHELYSTKNPDTEEIRLKEYINNSEVELERLRELNNSSSRILLENNTRIDSLEKSILNRSFDIINGEKDFKKRCNEVGFSSVKNFKDSILSEDRINTLTKIAENIEKSFLELSTRLTDRKQSLKIEEDLNLPRISLDMLKNDYNEITKRSRELGEELGGLKSNLTISLNNKEKVRDSLNKIENQKTEVENWKKLHSLIGSADGKKYRNFAQGLTFEQMVGHANRELIKMSDRYILIRDVENPLELNVIDNYQAGEIRSTKNLSGGESFIISLSLALGLSNMASNKVRVDSLFLDEGFGTLDEEALETALETLSTLHQHGKLIGIISHIPALKERISTQINVIKTSGGRGKIFGPGCKSV